MSSRIKIWQIETQTNNTEKFIAIRQAQIVNQTATICTETLQNLQYLSALYSVDAQKSVGLVRYEDVAYLPVEMAQRIYSFLGRTFTKK